MPRPRISERELDVMQTLWSLGHEATVGELHEAMVRGGSPLAYTTVQTMLNRLAAKGHVRRRMAGRAWQYAAVVKEPAAARVALRTLVDRFFAGSAGELAARLVEEEMTEAELRRIENLIDERRKGRR
jgi:predicted transcriptional regulator